MKTTRTLLFVLAAALALATAGYTLLHLSLPVAALFEYGAGTLVTTGLITMLLLGEGTTRRRLPTATPPVPPARPRRCRTTVRPTFAHAA